MNVAEQKELLIKSIEEDEELIATLKETIKSNKSKLKKIEKLEKEIQDIFGVEDISDTPIEEDEIPGQMCLDGYAA